jgi:CheY-like chemotaxis protein
MADTVLVVEDDRANAVLIETILTSFGEFEVLSTDDGDEVMAVVADRRVDAVLMDVSLGNTRVGQDVVDGVELTRRLRATRHGADLPVILLTAHAMRGDRELLLFSSGANDYVAKPITDQKAFVELVTRHIRTRQVLEPTKESD